ncbi:MAG: biotin--[acetyl-CoA-carboxylase] ligase [Alkalibacterium sp.]|nr:biotin--[acetyl-CoA-carboxylase] ligase [Alkalibacterium sp.]
MIYSSQLISYFKSHFPYKIPLHKIVSDLEINKTDVLDSIDALIEQGYPMYTSEDHYQFSLPLIHVEAIKKGLNPSIIGKSILFKDQLPSTNGLALENLASFSHGEVILTDFQTSGKGRMGRSWQASLGKSIAMSIILKPTIDNRHAVLLTQLTAAALAKALGSLTDVLIKWPNDMIVNNKKVAGILTESQFNGNVLEGIVIGTGINTNLVLDEMDKKIQSKATSLFQETDHIIDPNLLIQSFIYWFDDFYTNWEQTRDSSPFIAICKEKSILLNREIIVRQGESSRLAQVVDINPLGELIIQYKGEEALESLQSLDFSIRGKDAYI